MAATRLIKGFMTVGGWTLASRVLGFARDILIAAFLGAGPIAEAFLVAFSLPNMFRRFFAEGAFNMAFVPMFSKKVETGDAPLEFARDAFSGMALLLTAFSALGVIFMPGLVWLMASGFAEDERFGLAVVYGRIAFPYILFISLAALLAGVLNGLGRFTAAAAAPVLLNVIFILAMLLTTLTGTEGGQALGLRVGDALALSVPLAGIAQLALVWWAARRAGYPLRFRRPRMTPELWRLARIAAPAALAGGVVQVNLLVGRQVASYFDGAIGWLNYADRLYQLPLGVVGIAIGVVLLPELSRRLAAGDLEGQRNGLNRAAEVSLGLTIPAAVALMVVPGPLVQALFQRGAFTTEDAANTALALTIYGLGLPAFVLQKVLQPLYFAREDTKRPFYYALVSLALNAGIAIGLAPFIGFAAAAVGTTLAAWGMVLQLWLGSREMGEVVHMDATLRRRLPRMLLSAALMGLALWGFSWLAAPMFAPGGARAIALLLLVALGAMVYFGCGQVVGAFRLADFRGALKRRG
ncbi:murein biosynthesis integral membrane protein MurJ [Frigidibacter sp. ROC022]|uniref:murein biosynthesis integral membrane protein MurJ n=1 Tax=Frigidibacter sp. ROC022 TaxID=2971796 RepID=UPI00215B436A|nr:murein biosynthesis integral membrane protein MurJ [Frigidibacter sp. ROC022]MCR8724026.1 murein biosynthesis integral membrane protein MurJ [Frigidibacter sp. ROC022]